MEITRESLQQRYADLTDAALLKRLRSTDLTDLAREIALQEMTQRGLVLSPVENEAASPPPDFEFTADQFTQNPYQSPRAGPVERATSRPRSPLPRILWWFYTGGLGLLVLVVMAQWVLRGAPAAEGLGLALNAWAVAGLAGWRLRRPLLSSWVWVACFALTLTQAVLLARILFGMAFTDADKGMTLVLSLALALSLPALPLLWGLLSYAFLSPSIWRRPAET
ncbi:hypothetical protein DFR29_101210 [Tahibacter aquaticus]|uniref:Uncharacterized protein n=1 Tax=Tahibacter aquaticus TaxID=520092 RepID=A0A4R6Z9K8_9GAMM|nr:hypothetical protein [Tahibacter aquaticus]TDR48590.1 hypothetical protein DFR29_101210 [Tahibacter aquaticus]